MTGKNDVVVDFSKFSPDAVSQQVKDWNEHLTNATKTNPRWWQVGAAKYREMRRNGETPLPKPVMLDGTPFHVPSRDNGRSIPCRVMKSDHQGPPKSVIMHIHGGGWVLQSEESYDPWLKQMANGGDALVISVGYRLAPEHAFPAGPDDCDDAADWLVDNALKEFGATLQFIGGDSAGGHLTMLAYLHLSQSRPNHILSGLILHYGCFDLSKPPAAYHFNDELILNQEIYDHYIQVVCPGKSKEELKDPSISPMYANFQGLILPPAVFMVGTRDMLVDDTVFMSAKYQMAGGETITKIYPGCPHGFANYPHDVMPPAKEAHDVVMGFLKAKTRAS